MLFGAITNSWREQLNTNSLTSLVQEAARRGARHVELRQGSLGNCEVGEGPKWRPVLPALQALVDVTPGMSFNLAVAFPCLSTMIDPIGDLFRSALRAAVTVNPSNPHLRMVDYGPDNIIALMKRIQRKLRKSLGIVPYEKTWKTINDLPEEALAMATLTREAAIQGVTLSIENTSQPIGSLHMLLEVVRNNLAGHEAATVGLCPDVVNQRKRFPETHAESDLDLLPADMIKIVHLKQTRAGISLPQIGDGDVDYYAILKSLASKGYAGPLIVEIPAHPNAFENLSDSYKYLSEIS